MDMTHNIKRYGTPKMIIDWVECQDDYNPDEIRIQPQRGWLPPDDAPLPNLEWEAIFKSVRSDILLGIHKLKNDPKTLRFQIALSLQCFINEYLYNETDKEVEALKELENLIKENLNKGKQPSPTEIACLASYKPLYQCSWIHLVTMPVELEVLKRRQILEPQKEIQLGSTIPILKRVEDKVSLKVQEQYERNPYPKWLEFGFPPTFKSVSEFIKSQNLKISNPTIKEVDNPQILVAGCGTGLHPITSASLFKTCNVLAIDLSLNSLAYAKRKTEELSISNIEYMQADILDLALLDRKFDIIECVGVLHHMGDPIAGWKVLTDCLKTGGIMRLGLYSKLGRSDIIKARNEIKQLNIGSSDTAIKSYRHKILNAEPVEEYYNSIVSSLDFYSMSEFRDLLFHVQEHRFTITQIIDAIRSLGLYFCGFENIRYSGRSAGADLKKWDIHEKEDPKIFEGMYQFWCQKI